MYDDSDYSDTLLNLAAAYESKLKNLSEVKNITFELKSAIEEEEASIGDDSDYFDVFDEILNRRGTVIEEQEIIITTINHYKFQLPPDMLGLVSSAERGCAEDVGEESSEITSLMKKIRKISGAEKIIYGEIQAAENFNLTHMKKLMDNVKKKLDHIKKNRIIMDRFVIGDNDIKTGALINKKK